MSQQNRTPTSTAGGKPAIRKAEAPPPRRSTRTGDIRFRTVGGRRVSIWLPPEYTRSGGRFPVVYLQDGQNVFDAATSAVGVEWEADETATRLIAEKKIPPIIMVGIENTRLRKTEYSAPVGRNPGTGEEYARYMAETLAPFIDSTYRTTAKDAAVIGSSLGANISLYVCARYPEQFSRCAALSPAIWWQGKGFVDHLEQTLKTKRLAIRCGKKEGPNPLAYVKAARRLRDALTRAGLDISYAEIEDGGHNEADWARQLPDILEYLFGRED